MRTGRILSFDARPLAGRRVLFFRAEELAEKTDALLKEVGAIPVSIPLIEYVSLARTPEVGRAIAELRGGEWLAFTSAAGVRFFREALESTGDDARRLGGCRVAAIGRATAAALQDMGIRADFVPSVFEGEAFAKEWLTRFRNDAPSGVKLFRAEVARDVFPETLRQAEVKVSVISTYRTRRAAIAERLASELMLSPFAVIFSSPSMVDSFFEQLAERANSLLSKTRVISIGPVTSAVLSKFSVLPTSEAKRFDFVGIREALVELAERS